MYFAQAMADIKQHLAICYIKNLFSFFIGLNDRLGKLRPIPAEEE